MAWYATWIHVPVMWYLYEQVDEILRRDNKLREQLEKKSQAMRSESVLDSSSLPHKSTASRSGSVLSDSAPIAAAWLQSSGASLTESHKQSKESAACRQQPRETSPDCVSLMVLIQLYVNKNVKKNISGNVSACIGIIWFCFPQLTEKI